MAADTFQFKRGTTAAVNAYLPAIGEPVYDITLKKLRIGDGVTLGGVDPNLANVNLTALAGLVGAADRGFYFTGPTTMGLFDLAPAGRTFLGATSAATQRVALGLDIGVNVQAFDSDLSALAANATNGLWARTAAGTGAARTITGTANKLTVTNGDGVAGNPTLTLPDALTLVTPTVTGLLSVTGGQIKFPAVQVPSVDANTLDDYVEGTFTPTLTFSTPGDLNVVYGTRVGTYTKVGRLVHFTINITTTTFTHTTAAGALLISGLPFPVSGNPSVSLVRWVGVTTAVTTPQMGCLLNGSNVQFEVMNVAAGTTSAIQVAGAPTGVQKNIFVSGTYNV